MWLQMHLKSSKQRIAYENQIAPILRAKRNDLDLIRFWFIDNADRIIITTRGNSAVCCFLGSEMTNDWNKIPQICDKWKKQNKNIIYQPTASFPFQLLLSGVTTANHLNLSPVSTSLTQNLLHVKAENCYINIFTSISHAIWPICIFLSFLQSLSWV